MASTLRKIADKLEGKGKEHDNPHSSNFGPHSSAVANKVDPLVDSDLDGRNDPTSRVGGYGNTQQTNTHGSPGLVGTTAHSTTTTSGPHNSDLANKLDPRVDSTQTSHVGAHGTSHTAHHTSGVGGLGSTTTTSHHSANAGPHNSNLANKLDPRVDSDLDGRNDPTSRVGGYGNTQTATGAGYGSANTATGNLGENPRSTNSGPHSSNLMNKLDPRVDSDVNGRNDPTSRVGGYGNTQTTTGAGYGVGNTHTTHDHAHGNGGSTNVGPHSNNLMNKLDPRVDSDLDGRNNPNSHISGHDYTNTATGGFGGPTTTGYTGSNDTRNDPRSTNTGPHSSNLLNKLDPRVDSDRDGRNDPNSRTGGYGNTQTTTGGVGRY